MEKYSRQVQQHADYSTRVMETGDHFKKRGESEKPKE
jgi:hypothetical protein